MRENSEYGQFWRSDGLFNKYVKIKEDINAEQLFSFEYFDNFHKT